VELYRAVERLVLDCGDVSVSVSKTTVTFKGRRRGFAGARPTARGVQGYLDLTRSLAGDPRIRSVAPYTKRLYVNHYLLSSPDDLDDTFRSWVREAYLVGAGEHLGG
jgi:hypothetical protein